MVSTCPQMLYFLYHLGAFGLFLTFNIVLFSGHEFAQPEAYDVLLIVIIAIGYVFYYELAVIILVLVILVPIFCCVACCCPRNLGNNSWTPTPQSLIQRLTRSNFKQEQHEAMKECIICQEEYKEGDQLITLDCDSRHYFH